MNEIVLKIIQYTELSLKKNQNGRTLKQLLATEPFEQVVESICSDEEIVKLIDTYNCFEQYVNFLRQIKFEQNNKIIESITEKDILFSKKLERNHSLSKEEMEIVFACLKRNLDIYEKIYMNKVYKVETTLNKTVLLNIGHAKLFHLLGFNLIDMQKHYRKEILRVVPEMKEVLDKNYIDMCKDNDFSLLKALISIIKKEEDIIFAVSEDKTLSDKIFTSPKIKIKNFAFERLGLIESPSGIIFSTPTRTIKSDIFVLRDFIRDYNLNWIFNGYAHEREIILPKTLGSSKKIITKNAETLLIEPDDSCRFDGSLVGISSAVGSMNKRDFDFKVSTITTEEASDVIQTDFEFEEDDIKFMAQKIISNFPNLDLSNLNNLVNSNPNKK